MASPDLQQLIALVREHGLPLEAKQARLDETGADFLVAHAIDEQGIAWVVRVPKRAEVVERAGRERQALSMLSTRLPVAVPQWQVFSPRLIAYPRLGGDPAAVLDPSAGGYRWRFDPGDPPPEFLGTLAHALAVLHGIDHAAARAAGLPVERPPDFRDRWVRRIRTAQHVLSVPDTVWRRWQQWLADESLWPQHAVLVHGDLHPPHILIDERRRVTGLLDWTEAHVGDAATDFALLFATLGERPLAKLLEQYRAAGAEVWPRMLDHIREMWCAYPSVVAEFVQTSGEQSHLALAQALVDAAAAGMP
jgi:macrolide phosphotransferase